MREDNELYFSDDDDLREIVKRYEAMVKSNRVAYFDVCDYEKMIDHYILQDRSEDAINVLRIARKQHPNSSELTIKKAEVELISGNYKDALKDLSSVEAVEKNNPDFYLIKGKTFMATGKVAEALDMFDMVLQNSTDQKMDMLFEVVSILEEHDEFDLASKCLKQGVDIDATNTQLYGELGFIEERMNRTDEAIGWYEKMLEYDPFLAYGWSNLGTLYAKLGKNEQAVEAFEYAIALEPDGSHAYFSKANALANSGNFKDALDMFLEYAEMEEDTSMAKCCIAECYEKMGDYENARTYYKESIEGDATNPDALYGLAVVELEFENVEESYDLAMKAIEADPNVPEYWFGLGKLNMRLEKTDEAKAAFETAIALDPFDFESWLLLTEVNADESLLLGLETIQRALKEINDVASLHFRHAALLYLLGSSADSLSAFEKGLVIDNSCSDEFFELCADAINDPRFIDLLSKYLPSKN